MVYMEKKTSLPLPKFREYFSQEGIFQYQVYEGITDLLQTLRSNKCIPVIATSKPTVYATQVLDGFSLTSYFELVSGSNLDGTRVQKYEVIEYALITIWGSTIGRKWLWLATGSTISLAQVNSASIP